MARLFTITFLFNEEPHSTLVTVKTTPYYKEYTLINLSADLLQRLPGNKIISPTDSQFTFPEATSQHSAGLMASIIKAVSQHLQIVAG